MNAYTLSQRRADTLTPVVGDAFQARATHPYGRSLLRVSALCVGIAIASCSPPRAFDPDSGKRDEIRPDTYRSIAATNMDATERAMVRRFMADGKIDYGELEQLNDYEAAQRDAQVPLAAIKGELAQ